jgi:hypothetical protein
MITIILVALLLSTTSTHLILLEVQKKIRNWEHSSRKLYSRTKTYKMEDIHLIN